MTEQGAGRLPDISKPKGVEDETQSSRTDLAGNSNQPVDVVRRAGDSAGDHRVGGVDEKETPLHGADPEPPIPVRDSGDVRVADPGAADDGLGQHPGDGDGVVGEPMSKQSARVQTPLPAAAFSGQLPLTREQSNPLESLTDRVLTSEQKKEDENWLKLLLPSLSHGWWDVAANGKGFVIKQRWRNKGQQTQTYPRVSREQFFTLKEKDKEDAKAIIEDAIIGHIEECLRDRSAERRARAGCAAERLGLKH